MSITVKLPRILSQASLLAFALTSSFAFASSTAETNGDKVDRGIENVKQGTKEAAEGLSSAASEAGAKASVGAKKVGLAIKSATCPIVGDRRSKMYYAKDSKSYAAILDGQKFFEDDDRACFMSEEAARSEGYSRSAN